jgi:hypothetical protein
MKAVKLNLRHMVFLVVLFCGCAPKPIGVQIPTTAPATQPSPCFVYPGSIPDGKTIPPEWYPLCAENCWKVIVIHHSASDFGGAKTFNEWHQARGWDELGYHFVIGNGTDTPDGYVEVGNRWLKQKRGSHAKSADNFFNEYGIGICMVGNFEKTKPTAAQIRSLHLLMEFLMTRYDMTYKDVYGHKEVKGNQTDCPGKNVSMDAIRKWAKDSPVVNKFQK